VNQEATVTLWRPTGPEELALVEASGWTAWPLVYPSSPSSTPFSTRIKRQRSRATDVKASGVGYVTRFQVKKSFMDRYEAHQAGGRTILEY
jgi:hypothetical protein